MELKNVENVKFKSGTTLEFEKSDMPKYLTKSIVLDTSELGQIINSAFKAIFSDYKGTNFRYSNGVVIPLLWFDTINRTECSGAIKGTKETNEKERNISSENKKWMNTFNNINSRISGKYVPFKLSDDAKDFLDRFNKTGKPLASYVTDRKVNSTSLYNQSREILIKVANLDLASILAFIYGEKNEEGDVLLYRVNFKKFVDDVGIIQNASMMPLNDEDGDRRIMLVEINIMNLTLANNRFGGRVGNVMQNDCAPIF